MLRLTLIFEEMAVKAATEEIWTLMKLRRIPEAALERPMMMMTKPTSCNEEQMGRISSLMQR